MSTPATVHPIGAQQPDPERSDWIPFDPKIPGKVMPPDVAATMLQLLKRKNPAMFGRLFGLAWLASSDELAAELEGK